MPFWSIPTKASGTASSSFSNLVVFEDICSPFELPHRTRNWERLKTLVTKRLRRNLPLHYGALGHFFMVAARSAQARPTTSQVRPQTSSGPRRRILTRALKAPRLRETAVGRPDGLLCATNVPQPGSGALPIRAVVVSFSFDLREHAVGQQGLEPWTDGL